MGGTGVERADHAPLLHVGLGLVGELGENVGGVALGKVGHPVGEGPGKGEDDVLAELDGGLAELGHEQDGEEHGADEVDGDGGLAVLGRGPDVLVDAGVLDDDVEPVELGGGAGGEPAHRVVAGQVEGPDVDDVAAAARGPGDGLGGAPALVGAADGEDDPRGAESSKVPGRLEAHARVGAGHDDGLVGEAGGRVGEGGEELGADVGPGRESGCRHGGVIGALKAGSRLLFRWRMAVTMG